MKETETLLASFPILKSFLKDMAGPLLGPAGGSEDGSCVRLSGKSGTAAVLFSASQDGTDQGVVAEAFQQALNTKDLNRALTLLELYAQNDQQEALRDKMLICTALDGKNLNMLIQYHTLGV